MNAQPHLTDYRPPGGRMPPPEVVAQLREVDPRAELIYVGKGRWMLGTVRHDRELYVKAVRAVGAYLTVLLHATPMAKSHVDGGPQLEINRKTLAELNFRLWKKLLQLRGFKVVCVFRQNMPDSHFAEAFRAGDWIWKHKEAADRMEKEQTDEAEGITDLEERQASVVDYLQAEGRSLHRRVFRGRTMVQKDVDGFEKQQGVGHTHNERRSAVS